jgi:hypothetical protein
MCGLKSTSTFNVSIFLSSNPPALGVVVYKNSDKVEKFRGENDVKFIQKNGVEPYVIGDRVEFSFDRIKLRNGDEQRVILRAIYKKNSNTLKTETTPLKISDDEVDRLNNKYFD